MTLPPLSLDDIRVAGPDRDNAEAFDPAETWCLACDKIAEGYTADTVAGLLLDMPLTETSLLWQWWEDECRSVLEDSHGRDANCPDLALAVAIAAEDAREWRLPLIDPYSVLVVMDRGDELYDENCQMRALCQAVLKCSQAAAWLARLSPPEDYLPPAPTLFHAIEAAVLDFRNGIEPRPIPLDAIGTVCNWAEAFFSQAADDDEVSAEEEEQREEGRAALDLVNSWLTAEPPADLAERDAPVVSENAQMREVLADARTLIAEWQTTHVYDMDGGDVIPTTDAGTVLLARIAALIGEPAGATGGDEPDDRCTGPKGHEWSYTGTAYGGDDERWQGEGRVFCIHCGADGDA